MFLFEINEIYFTRNENVPIQEASSCNLSVRSVCSAQQGHILKVWLHQPEQRQPLLLKIAHHSHEAKSFTAKNACCCNTRVYAFLWDLHRSEIA